MNATRREALGRIVRDTWITWAREQPDPKPSWLTGWNGLDPGQREVDMRVGEAVAAVGHERAIVGYCPACGWESLVVAKGGHITCCRIGCPRPTAADELLADREPEHIVVFSEDEFTIRHPLREHLDDALLKCMLHAKLSALPGPPVRPGCYRARRNGTSWAWEVA
jgi:hypothetical protein